MARPRQPIALVEAKGSKHLTKSEIAERRSSEVQPLEGLIEAPAYLTKKQKEEFYKIADQLKRLKILGETDVDALARYVTVNDRYVEAVKKMRSKEVKNDPELLLAWSKLEDKYFRQVRSAASDLGLTISSRCRLVVPETKTETPKENKFKKFEKGQAVVNG